MPVPTNPHQAILDHWFADGLSTGWPSTNMQARWFGGAAEEDALIASQFGPLVESAQAGRLTEWESGSPLTRLALVILLDQFSRNLYRGQARAFAGDGRAQKLVLQSLALATDEDLPTVGRVFFYMPLMHAESTALQHECVLRFTRLHASAPPELQEKLLGNLQAARQHSDIIDRFGRFPHRNAVLGRSNTPEEAAFLETGPRFGQ